MWTRTSHQNHPHHAAIPLAFLLLAVTLVDIGPSLAGANEDDSVGPSEIPANPRTLRLGLRAGVGLPWLSFDEKDLVIRFEDEVLVGVVPVDNTVRPSFVGGLALIYEMSPRFALEPRLFFCGQGGQLEGDALVTIRQAPEVPFRITVQETYKLAYLEIPVLARLASRQGSQRAYLGLGPVAGILLLSKYVFEATAQVSGFYPDVYAENLDVRDQSESVTFGMLSVFGVEFRGNQVAGFLELSFEFGLTDAYENLDVKSRVIGITLGVGY